MKLNRKYKFKNIVNYCNKNDLTTVDCLKDENIISVEEFYDGELGGVSLMEFSRIKDDVFKLIWINKSFTKLTSKTCKQSARV